MHTKLFEVRDRATFLPVLAVRLDRCNMKLFNGERYLIGRCGYGSPGAVLLTALNGGRVANCDPYAWGDRTLTTAHRFIEYNFDELDSGAVVDVEYILQEKACAAESERFGS